MFSFSVSFPQGAVKILWRKLLSCVECIFRYFMIQRDEGSVIKAITGYLEY